MTRWIITMLAVGTFLGTAGQATAQEGNERKDRATYNRLVRQVRTGQAKLRKLEEKALDEAHRNNGQASDPVKAEILSLQDEIERKTNRLQLLTLRHGWEMPDLSKDAVLATATSSRAEVFAPVDRMIRGALSDEARHLAEGVYLPVISNPVPADRS